MENYRALSLQQIEIHVNGDLRFSEITCLIITRNTEENATAIHPASFHAQRKQAIDEALAGISTTAKNNPALRAQCDQFITAIKYTEYDITNYKGKKLTDLPETPLPLKKSFFSR